MSSQTTSTSLPPSVLTDDGLSGVTDSTGLNRSDPDRWYFLKERLDTTPSRKSGIDADKELTYRQQSANFIQDIGQRLQVNQLCINTAIVYMHRFYMFHSFTQFHRNAVSAASIFLAAKVEEQPRKLEHVIKVAHYCLHRDHQPQIDTKSEQYLEQSAELVMNENILLQTLGFDVAIDHPHTHVVKCCQLVRASKDLAQTSYFMATNSLHLTTMCLQYKPTVVACVCIHLACKWSSWEIPRSKEGKDWFWYVDDTVTSELLEKLTTDFLQIFNKSPSRLKKKIISLNAASTSSLSLTNVPYHGFDSSPGQPHNRSRSPSPKRPVNTKPSSSQPGHPGKVKLPPGASFPHHLLPKPSGHHPPGVAGSGNKHPHPHPSSHSSSGKPPHPCGMPPGGIKDPHHPQHPKQPYPHGHGQNVAHGQYPHGSRPGMPSSGSSQSHHGHGGHSKPPGSGSASSHPYSSSSSMKNMQAHNPSKPPHMPPSGAPKMPPNQVPGAVKNPNQPMFHSSQSHVKKPYGSEGRPEFGMKREGPASGSMHHSQNHARPHDKVVDGRHHSSASGMPQSHSSTSQSSSDSRSSTHHNMPYLAQDMDRSGGSSNQKLPYMDSRSMDPSDMNRHRNMPPSDPKRAMSHGAPTATNGNNNDSVGSKSTGGAGVPGVGESHVPSKNAFRPPGSTLGQHSQSEMGAKYHSDSFGGEYGSSYGSNSSNSNILTIEDRRKRRHADTLSTSNSSSSSSGSSTNANKRPRPDNYASSASTLPLSTSSLFSPEEPSDSNKRLPQVPSQFSPPPMETAPSGYSKVPDLSQHSGNSYSGGSDGITFGSTETKADLRRVNPSSEFQAPELLPPINDTPVKMDHKEVNSAPRAASLFSPEFTPSNSVPPTLKISPHPDIHKRDVFSSTKAEAPDNILLSQQTTSGYSEGSSQHSFTGRLSSSPKREDGKDDDSHSSKNKKKKKEKHKHKHKEEKKHKKDKHKEKDKEKEKDKDKKERHRTKEKHSAPPVEVSNDVSSHKIKIKIGRDESKRSAVQPLSSHSSSKTTNSSSLSIPTSNPVPMTTPLPGLKVKISSKGRVSSVDDDAKYEKSKQDLSGGGSTPCCPGIGPCVKCNREQDQYGYFNAPLTLKIAKSKDPSKSSKDSSSRDSKKSKDKSSKTSGSSSASLYPPHLPPNLSSSRPPSASNHYVHKNGVEKSSKKKEKSAPVL